jgi:putative serine protease PepD
MQRQGEMAVTRKSRVLLGLAGATLLAGGVAAGALLFSGDGDTETRIVVATATPESRASLGLTVSAVGSGTLRVATVEPGGPAAQAGIQSGDVIRSVDGQIVRTPEQLRVALESRKPGDQVSVTYERGDR